MEKISKVYGNNANFHCVPQGLIRFFIILVLCFALCPLRLWADEIKQPTAAGKFYPDNPEVLSRQVDKYLADADPEGIDGEIFALVVPHAGYDFSGPVAAYAYKLIRGKPYKTVIIIAGSHYYGFKGVSIYPTGFFRTPLGDIEIDRDFISKLLNLDPEIYFDPQAFSQEHSLEVQIPFLQRSLTGWKIVPIIMGECTLLSCKKLAGLIKEAIGARRDVLVVASTDMYHGHDYQECPIMDGLTNSFLNNMDDEGLYYGLREGKLQLCGGLPAVTTLILAKSLGHKVSKLLKYTNSAEVTGNKIKGIWTVGYSSWVIDAPAGQRIDPEQSRMVGQIHNKEDAEMFSLKQKKKLLELARSSVETYLKTGRRLEVYETDPELLKPMGAFVTLSQKGELRGCIGNLIGSQPIYLTIRDMAVEAAVSDPRFLPVKLVDLAKIEIEISALSAMERVDTADKIILGKHGVLIKQGYRSGVFLPQVATETGWSKEEFLSNLCSHKAGLPDDAWKKKGVELYIFTAEVFSEKELRTAE
ncbi:MAG: AmmeMemoRadiSam system protein B [Candidatus Omnitrophica bacterium]|nr:AmmeMemoRadiSam system protein B [Candidatus Omnitrophota bacterium]MBU2221458.1 AmmeMemoRadiSam system protein B [Candidatus Omnitrophota bacterium]